MNVINIGRFKLLLRVHTPRRSMQTSLEKNNPVQYLCKYLSVNESEAKYICLKYPVVNKLGELKMNEIVENLQGMGFPPNTLIKEPVLFGILPVTLRFRYQVLIECGFHNVSPRDILSYLPIVKQKKIGELKEAGVLLPSLNVENRLASYMTQWPTSLTTLINRDVNEYTLYTLRLKIVQRYLELILDLSNDEFYRGIKTYPTVKHRPLAVINETLTILQSKIMMPTNKIKSNLYLIHADPDNLKNIIYSFRSIGGIDIREIIRMYPKLALKNYSTMEEIRKILKEYGISDEAQRRCFAIYTLSPETIEKRLKNAKGIPEFQALFHHPRFLKMIHYNNTAMKRLSKLYDSNKKCLSLNVLSGSSEHYEKFEKTPGDRIGKGKDLLFCLTECVGNHYSMNDVRRALKRHPFWVNVPVVQVKYVYQNLSREFSQKDIYDNCPILLYPWKKIRESFAQLKKYKEPARDACHYEHIDLIKLSQSQKLSLVLYMLEKRHYFTGNGVWEDNYKYKNIVALNEHIGIESLNCDISEAKRSS